MDTYGWLVILCIAGGLVSLVSALVLVSICMFSSMMNQAGEQRRERLDEWGRHE